MQPDRVSPQAFTRGLQLDVQRGVGGVVCLRVGAQQQHEGAWGAFASTWRTRCTALPTCATPATRAGGIRVVERGAGCSGR